MIFLCLQLVLFLPFQAVFLILCVLLLQVLFKNLAVDMKDVKPTSLLKDRVRDVEGNPDFSNKDVIAPQAPVITEVTPGIVPSMAQAELHQEANSTSNVATHQNVLNQVGNIFFLLNCDIFYVS